MATCLLIGAGGNTFLENIVIICSLFCTLGLFAYILSTISLIIEEINKKTYEYR